MNINEIKIATEVCSKEPIYYRYDPFIGCNVIKENIRSKDLGFVRSRQQITKTPSSDIVCIFEVTIFIYNATNKVL